MELRVYGMGAPDPGAVLNCAPAHPPVLSWDSEPGSRSAIRHCPGDYDTHVYHWSPLTSGSRSFAVWPLLLPFTLVNVVGWMPPPRTCPRRVVFHRVAAVWVGLATTAAAVVWLLVAARTVWRKVDVPDWLPGAPTTGRFWLVALSAAAAMSVLVLAATYTATGFERFRPTRWGTERQWRWPWGASLSARLDDPRFYDSGRDHEVRWRVHTGVAVLTWSAVVAFVVWWDGIDRADHVLGRAVLVVWGLQVVGVGVLALVAIGGQGGGRGIARRVLGAATAMTGIMLLSGLVLSALIAVTSLDAIPRGPVAVLYDCFGWAMLVALAGALVCVLRALMRPTAAEAAQRTRSLVPTLEARLRARLATVPSSAGLAVMGLAVGFVVSSAFALVFRWSKMWDDEWRLTETTPVNIARLTFVFLLGFLILNLWKSRASPAALRRIGNVWDILTFWPRAFRPFAVRPYAERAVPELQEFLRTGPRHHGLVVSAHNQGSVLMYTAVRPFVEAERAEACPLPLFALVTFGSPLNALYGAAFPYYFDVAELDETRSSIAGGWSNYFRMTDHVGRAVFTTDEEALAAYARDEVIADHPVGDADAPDRRVNGHNDYWANPAIRAAVDHAGANLEDPV